MRVIEFPLLVTTWFSLHFALHAFSWNHSSGKIFWISHLHKYEIRVMSRLNFQTKLTFTTQHWFFLEEEWVLLFVGHFFIFLVPFEITHFKPSCYLFHCSESSSFLIFLIFTNNKNEVHRCVRKCSSMKIEIYSPSSLILLSHSLFHFSHHLFHFLFASVV